MRNGLLAAAASLALLAGCQPAARMEEAPPAEQKVVMVPSWKEGQPVQKPNDPASQAEAAPALPPGSKPDGPQPGDLDYSGR
jgi:hypothetical protein